VARILDGQLGNQGSITGRGTYDSPLYSVQTNSGAALPCLLSNRCWQLFHQQVKYPGHGIGHSLLSSTETKNVRGYTSIYLHCVVFKLFYIYHTTQSKPAWIQEHKLHNGTHRCGIVEFSYFLLMIVRLEK
jgi:hypothetical protein